MKPSSFPRWTLALLLLAITPLAASGGDLRAAAVKIDITPDTPQPMIGYAHRMSNGVHTPLFHRILVLDDGQTKTVIASTEVCLVSPAEYDRTAALVEKAHGIPPLHFFWTVTHTHSAPQIGPHGMTTVYLPSRTTTSDYDRAYNEKSIRQLVDGIGAAIAKLEPARLGVGSGSSDANINRRERAANGSIVLGNNPQGAVDRHIGVLKLVKRTDNAPLAALANYAIHATVLGPKSLLISGDATGIAAAHVEEKIGVPMLFVNGAAGNIAPIYSVCPTPAEGRIDEFKSRLGDPILTALGAVVDFRDSLSVQSWEAVFETPRKTGLGWNDDLAAYTRTGADGLPLVRMPCRFLRLDKDILAWSAPAEIFCEYALAARASSPYAHTFFFGYTNGWFGYLPTAEGFAEGGYETTVTPFSPAVDEPFREFVRKQIRAHSP